MARPQVPDTSVLLDAIYRPERWPALQRSLQSGRTWLSSVVVAELYAGTRSREDGQLVDRIVAPMQRVGRLLTPTAGDWARAGHLIARRVRLQGSLRPRDHLADLMILVSAARISGVVVTANLRHFEAWGRLATSAGLDVAVQSALETE